MRYHIVIASGLLAVLATAYPCNAQTDVLPIKSTIPKASPKVRVLLEGFCPVSVVDDSSWVLGDDKYTTVHEKCGYRFANEQNKLQFENNPQKYAVALRGYDPVHLHQHKELVEGDRRYGLSSYKYGILLFANDDVPGAREVVARGREGREPRREEHPRECGRCERSRERRYATGPTQHAEPDAALE